MIRISYLNYWKDPYNDRWLSHFIKENIGDVVHVSPDTNPDILICSVCGNVRDVIKTRAKTKIFFTGENLERFPQYRNINILKKIFHLIIGFNNSRVTENIIRFPLWFMYYPYYNADNENDNILTYINNSYQKNISSQKTMFASCVSSHDRRGNRTIIYNEMIKYGKVHCPGNFKRNTAPIGKTVNDKINFISKSVYNICPENSEYEGYYTEKIFQALEAGTIPIYWAINKPEKDILNENCYCFVSLKRDELSCQIEDVVNNRNKYIVNSIFKPGALNVIKGYYNLLKTEIMKLLMRAGVSIR